MHALSPIAASTYQLWDRALRRAPGRAALRARHAPHRRRRGGARPPPPRGTRGRSSTDGAFVPPGAARSPSPGPGGFAVIHLRQVLIPVRGAARLHQPAGTAPLPVRDQPPPSAPGRGAARGGRREGSAESWASAQAGGGPSSVLPRWLPCLASALGWATSVEGTRRPEPSSPWCSASAARAAPSFRSCSGRRGERIPSRREPSGCASQRQQGNGRKAPSCRRVPPDRLTSGGASEPTDPEPQAADCWS